MTPTLNPILRNPTDGVAKRAPSGLDDQGFADLLESAWDFGLAAKTTKEPAGEQPPVAISILNWDRISVDIAPATVEEPAPASTVKADDGKPDVVDPEDPLAVLLMAALPSVTTAAGSRGTTITPIVPPARHEMRTATDDAAEDKSISPVLTGDAVEAAPKPLTEMAERSDRPKVNGGALEAGSAPTKQPIATTEKPVQPTNAAVSNVEHQTRPLPVGAKREPVDPKVGVREPGVAQPATLPAAAVATPPPVTVLALDPATQPQLVQAARSVTEAEVAGLGQNRTETLKLQLKPIELGSVMATLHASGGVLSVELVVETTEALHRLKSEAEAIGQSLRDLGLEVDKVSVQASLSVTPSDRANSSGQQFAPGDGRAASNGEARGERSTSDGRQGNSRNDRETGNAPSMAGDNRAAATGHYI